MKHKSFPAETKALEDSPGTFEALASVFENVDLGGDRVKRGAFKNSIDAWRAKGDPIPIILSHDWNDPWAHIGKADPKDVRETPEGLVVKGTLDIEDNDVAKQVYRLMKERRLTGWSFGYTVKNSQPGPDGAEDLMDIDLFEAGPTLRGMNPEAQLQAVKSALEAEDTSQEEPSSDADQEPEKAKSCKSDQEPSAATSRTPDPVADSIDRALLGEF